MQMDSFNYASFFHDEAPFYPHVAVPPSPELPFGLIASPGEAGPAPPFAPPMPTAFQDFDYSGAGAMDLGAGAPFGGPNLHALGGMSGDGQREQSMAMAEDGEEQEQPRRQRQQPAGGGAVESSRGFRHMMRERQRREKLSQSYADLHALVASRSRGDKNSIVQAAAIYIHELRGAREQLQRRNEGLKARILGHDARQQCVKVQFEVDEPASAIDSMIGALRRLKGMDVRARGIRSNLSGRRLCTEMNVETTASDMSQAWSQDPTTTTSSLDGTISKLPGKLDRLLRHGCTLPKGVEDEIPLIKGDLEKIVAISSDMEDGHAMMARCWRKEVRELSYDMEDFVDQYEHACAISCSTSMILGRKILTQQRRRSKTGLPWLREKLRQRLWIANKIREFSRRMQEALKRHSLYNLDAIAGASASSRHTCAYSDPAWNSTPCGEENAYVGISDAMEELSMMMHDDHGHQKLKVVSIVGFGGIGKTTLATKLYRKLGQQFECRAFVRTSQKPDMRRIFISMLSQVRPHQPPDNWTVHGLISTIRTHLRDKRYLIIVEDLCTTSTWDIVKYALPDRNRRSRILITTEIEDLALQSCDHDPKYVYKMKLLGEDNSRKLFFGSVFGPQHECPPELREISCNIVSKCGGLPLAIVTVASILSSQPGVQGQWDYVNKSIGESLSTNPTSEGMKQVLDLSYNSLPQHLKACILYTGLYEEDIIIWKDDLVNQWIAEGFIHTTEEQDKKEIGRSFFDRLISGKLIIPVDINKNGEVLSCVVHRMVLDLVIRDKSMEENFVTAIHDSQADTTLADKVRRLSLQFGNAEDATPPSNMRLSHVRTLAFLGVFKCLPSIVQFRLLQVLILHFWGDKDIISFDITRISELFRLRYLKITSNVTLELGTQMRCLQSLETLAIDARVSAVPSDIVQLQGLLHLNLPAESNLLNGIGHMTSLCTLRYFDLSSNSLENVQSLNMLTNLGDLQLTCCTVEPESLNLKTRFLLNTVFEGLSNLKSLTLVPSRTSSNYTNSSNDDTGVTCMTISDGFSTLSSARPLLRSLEVSSRICIFLNTPKRIGQLHKLCILKFGVRKIDRDGLDVLSGLPALAILSLYVHTKPAARIVIGKTGFPVVKYFKFKCCDPWLKFEEGAMPNLRKLKLAFNACNAEQPSTMPVGINHLPELKEVSAKIGAARSEESHTRTAEMAFRNAIMVHAGCQRVNVQFGKQIVGAEDDQSKNSRISANSISAASTSPGPGTETESGAPTSQKSRLLL